MLPRAKQVHCAIEYIAYETACHPKPKSTKISVSGPDTLAETEDSRPSWTRTGHGRAKGSEADERGCVFAGNEAQETVASEFHESLSYAS